MNPLSAGVILAEVCECPREAYDIYIILVVYESFIINTGLS